MKDKISIILPIYNVGPYLKRGIDSLLNQSIGKENLEIIMVDDCSTDGSSEIIDQYESDYDCCKAIHLKENSGTAAKPRNVGIKNATGKYIMFLDPDDEFCDDCCETLHAHMVENDVDLVFGRFRRIFKNYIQKSYSPYPDDLETNYPGEELRESNPLEISDALWNRVFKKIVYGKDIEKNTKRDRPVAIVKVDSIKEEPDLLKIPPSIWTKIYKKDFLVNNNIKFPNFVCGEDMAFMLECFLKAKGIIFLNDFFSNNYYVREEENEDDKSITHNVDVKFLCDLMDAFVYCRELTDDYPQEIQNAAVNPHLMYWINSWKNSDFTKSENETILKHLEKLKEIHKDSRKSKVMLSLMSSLIETKSFTQKGD